jgi:hypothetical protein
MTVVSAAYDNSQIQKSKLMAREISAGGIFHRAIGFWGLTKLK